MIRARENRKPGVDKRESRGEETTETLRWSSVFCSRRLEPENLFQPQFSLPGSGSIQSKIWRSGMHCEKSDRGAAE